MLVLHHLELPSVWQFELRESFSKLFFFFRYFHFETDLFYIFFFLFRYNPNSATANIVSGVLDALSAGVLIYTGLVELLAHDCKFALSPFPLYLSNGI